MAVTNQDIKNFFARSGNNPAVTNPQLTRLAKALGARINEDGSNATPDQLVDFMYQELKNMVIYHEQDVAATTARAGVTF